MTAPILRVDRLRVTYNTGKATVQAIRDASLYIAEGEAVGLVGESGSGKSSLARAVLGLLPDRIGMIEGGRIVIAGNDVTRSTPKQWEKLRGRPIAIVFQDPLSYLSPVMRVDRQIAESIRLHDPNIEIQPRINELLDLVRLPYHSARLFAHELSGGMRQRVLLAIALGCRPRLLVADEPTTALDVTTQSEILALLSDLRQQLGMAMLLISHDLAVVSSNCNRAYVMYDGFVIEYGGTGELFGRPGHYYTAALVAAATAARDKDGRFVTIPGDSAASDSETAGCPFRSRCTHAIQRCAEEMPPFLPAWGAADHAARCWRFG